MQGLVNRECVPETTPSSDSGKDEVLPSEIPLSPSRRVQEVTEGRRRGQKGAQLTVPGCISQYHADQRMFTKNAPQNSSSQWKLVGSVKERKKVGMGNYYVNKQVDKK